ncbi:MAG: hypothetical protein FJY79_05105 [Candidatus Aminicenantes bacterium]|nr:hypothetical protein [Candidatus Aminicenantes bacterium]
MPAQAIVFWGLVAVLVFVPLPIGSVEEWAIFVFEAATIVLFLVYVAGAVVAAARARNAAYGGNGHPPAENTRPGDLWGSSPSPGLDDGDQEGEGPGASSALRFPLALKVLLGVFLAVSLLQVVPLPAGLVKVLSPRAFAIHRSLAVDGIAAAAPAWMPLSLSPAASLSKLVLTLCYGLFAFLVFRTARTRRRLEILVLVILGSALFQAFYGMAETFSGHEMILGRPKRYNLGSVTGTFVNRNHFAGFLEMAFPLSLGYLLVKARYFQMERGLSLRRRILWFGQENLQWTFLYALASVFIGVGLVFSKSRSGIMILLLTVLLAGVAAVAWRGLSDEESGARRRFGRLVLGVFAVVLAAALYFGIGPIIARFAESDISKDARRTFYRTTARMIGDYPLFGTGKGSFPHAYAMYEEVDDRLRLSFAHNDFLEFAAENGLPGGAALAAAGIGLAVVLAGLWRRRRSNFAKGIGLGALLGVTAILVHGLSDFNLQITANAVYFVTLGIVGLNALARRGEENGDAFRLGEEGGPGSRGEEAMPGGLPGRPRGSRKFGRGSHPRVRAARIAPLMRPAAAALAAAVLLVPAVRDFLGFHHLARYRQARSAVRSVESGFPVLEPRILAAVRASGRAEFRVEQARLYVEMARVDNDAGRDESRDLHCDRAVDAFASAIHANPIDAFTHYEMGMVFLLYNFPLMTYADRAKVHFHRALELKPADEFLNLNVLFIHLTWWDLLEDEDKAYAAALLRRMTAVDPGFPAKLEARWKQSFKTLDRLRDILAELPR